MSMRRQSSSPSAAVQNAGINVTPFVDIMLVMLVIFMVAAPLATVSLRLDLPPALPGSPIETPPEPIYISIQEDGSIFVGEMQSSMQGLASEVCAQIGGDPSSCQEERVFVRAQPNVRYDALMQVMNDLNGHGFHKVGLLNEDIK